MSRIRDENGWDLVSHDEALGRTVWSYYDGQKIHYRTDYRVDDIIQQNASVKNDMAGQRWGDGKRVASIPLNVYYEQLAEAHTQGDERYMSRWLNDSDNAAFRTFEGNV